MDTRFQMHKKALNSLAYNAGKTLERTIAEIPPGIVDECLVVDDASRDDTVALARRLLPWHRRSSYEPDAPARGMPQSPRWRVGLVCARMRNFLAGVIGIPCIVHSQNRGYGANQKTCYTDALRRGADIVIMLHPDYQYSPRLIGSMTWQVASGEYDIALGSRILGTGALKGGMPLFKYVANRFLTAIENILLGIKLSEFHTGYRAFSRRVLETLPLHQNSDDFVFDNQILAQAVAFGFSIGEISCPTKYFPEASSINFRRSVSNGFGVLGTALRFRLHRWGILRSRLFGRDGRRLGATLPSGACSLSRV
jgi:glycosyltransferase involved in cell wall biosynthesis